MGDDVVELRKRLDLAEDELTFLKAVFEEYKDSSGELEDELDAQLKDLERSNIALRRENEQVRTQLQTTVSRSRQSAEEASNLTTALEAHLEELSKREKRAVSQVKQLQHELEEAKSQAQAPAPAAAGKADVVPQGVYEQTKAENEKLKAQRAADAKTISQLKFAVYDARVRATKVAALTQSRFTTTQVEAEIPQLPPEEVNDLVTIGDDVSNINTFLSNTHKLLLDTGMSKLLVKLVGEMLIDGNMGQPKLDGHSEQAINASCLVVLGKVMVFGESLPQFRRQVNALKDTLKEHLDAVAKDAKAKEGKEGEDAAEDPELVKRDHELSTEVLTVCEAIMTSVFDPMVQQAGEDELKRVKEDALSKIEQARLEGERKAKAEADARLAKEKAEADAALEKLREEQCNASLSLQEAKQAMDKLRLQSEEQLKQARLEVERKAKEEADARLAKEKAEADARLAKEKAEADAMLEKLRNEQSNASLSLEEAKQAMERLRLQNEEQLRIALEENKRKAKEEADARLAKEKAEADARLAKEKAEADAMLEKLRKEQSLSLEEAKNAMEKLRMENEEQLKSARTEARQMAEQARREALEEASVSRKTIEEEIYHSVADEMDALRDALEKSEAQFQQAAMKQRMYQQSMQNAIVDQSKHMLAAMKNARTELETLKRSAQSELAETQRVLNENLDHVRKVARTIAKSDIAQLSMMYERELDMRVKLQDQVQELRGNIRVFCRIRPLLSREIEAGESEAVTQADSMTVVAEDPDEPGKSQRFNFDRVFSPDDNQEVVFDEVRTLCLSALDGYNVCLFAYGVTGSGKTYTVEGGDNARHDPKQYGLVYRTVKELFRIAFGERAGAYDTTIDVQLLELYNEDFRDLLNEDDKAPRPDVRFIPEVGTQVDNVLKVRVNKLEDAMRVVKTGYINRTTKATDSNQTSSRSHSILTLHLNGVNLRTKKQYEGQLHFVDLAGSERVGKSHVHGDTLKEAQAINKSLSALGDVISALSKKEKFVPYRNSPLTMLLKDSLGGNSKTMMFINTSPCKHSMSETVSALRFATRVHKVEMGKAQKNESEEQPAEVKNIRNKLADIEAKFKTGKGGAAAAAAAKSAGPASTPRGSRGLAAGGEIKSNRSPRPPVPVAKAKR